MQIMLIQENNLTYAKKFILHWLGKWTLASVLTGNLIGGLFAEESVRQTIN